MKLIRKIIQFVTFIEKKTFEYMIKSGWGKF
jgi:hypothetical protein